MAELMLFFQIRADPTKRIQEAVNCHHVVRELSHLTVWKGFPGVGYEVVSFEGALYSYTIAYTRETIHILTYLGHSVCLSIDIHTCLLYYNSCLNVQNPALIRVYFSFLSFL